MTPGILLLACRLGGWRLAVNADSLDRVDRPRRHLHFTGGVQAQVDSIDFLWEYCPGSVIVTASHRPGVIGWVAQGADFYLLVTAEYFAVRQLPPDNPPRRASDPFQLLFGRIVVFQQPAAAVSLRQTLEIIPAQRLHALPELPNHFLGVLFWRDIAVPAVDWPAAVSHQSIASPSHYVVARSLEQRLLALPALGPIQLLPADSATHPSARKPAAGVLAYFQLGRQSVALLDLDALFASGSASGVSDPPSVPTPAGLLR